MRVYRPTPSELARDYDLRRGYLRPAYDRLADAHHIRRDPETGEVSWPPTRIEDELSNLCLI